MSIDELFKEKNMRDVLESLKDILEELKGVTFPIKKIINPELKKKDELFDKVRGLRIEVEELTKEMTEGEKRKDIKVIRKITERVKHIVLDKQKIQEEIRIMRLNGEI